MISRIIVPKKCVLNIFQLHFVTYATNLSVFVDILTMPTLVLFPLLLLQGHLHFPQVYSKPPGVDVADSHGQRPREQRGMRRDQAAGEALPGAQVRERDGAEVPA